MSAPVLSVSESARRAWGRARSSSRTSSFDVAAGEVFGIVGESGSGKTTVAQALLGYARPGLRIAAAACASPARRSPAATSTSSAASGAGSSRTCRRTRDGSQPLDPGRQPHRARCCARTRSTRARASASRQSLERVSLPADRSFLRRFPHQLSGGQQQRLAIATRTRLQTRRSSCSTSRRRASTSSRRRASSRRSRGSSRELARPRLRLPRPRGRLLDRRPRRGHVCRAHRRGGPDEVIVTTPRHPYSAGLISSVPDYVEPRRLHRDPGRRRRHLRPAGRLRLRRPLHAAHARVRSRTCRASSRWTIATSSVASLAVDRATADRAARGRAAARRRRLRS